MLLYALLKKNCFLTELRESFDFFQIPSDDDFLVEIYQGALNCCFLWEKGFWWSHSTTQNTIKHLETTEYRSSSLHWCNAVGNLRTSNKTLHFIISFWPNLIFSEIEQNEPLFANKTYKKFWHLLNIKLYVFMIKTIISSNYLEKEKLIKIYFNVRKL